MSDLSVQDANSVIEAFPMKTRRYGTSWKPRTSDMFSDKKTFKASKNADGKVLRKPSYHSRTDRGLKEENACQSCKKKSINRAFIHNSRRVSLPLRGKYANVGVHHSKTNNVASVKALITQRNTRGCHGRISNHRRASNEEAEPPGEPHIRWKNKADYFVAVLTYLLGVGNVILFPQLCFKHGGGAFFIPYFIMLLLEGIPLVCLEMAIGQRLGKSSLVEAWKDLSPNLHGIGMAALTQSLVTCFYYNYIVGWFLHYFFHSLRSTLLWETCPSSTNNGSETINVECEKSGPAEYYWYRQTLDVADDINESTGINMYLYLFVVIAWTVSFVLSMRGVRRISKVLLILLVLIVTNLVTFFFVGVHLDGWAEGLARLFIPEWERLLDPVVWMDAAGQIFYSLGVGFGALIILSGANQPNNNCYEDALICALGNCGMSVCASIVMFSFFGFRAYYKTNNCLEMVGKLSANGSTSKLGINMSCSKREIFDQIPPGLSLGFAGLSETFTEISFSPLWSSLFYFLLFCLGSSSMLGTLEVLITTFKEIGFFPQRWRNELLYGGVCLVFCISNLIFVQSTGFYLLEIISGASSLPLLLTGLAECVGVAYIYGMDKFSQDLARLTGKPVKNRWKICWKFISPLIILGVIIGGMVQMIRNIVSGKFSYTAWDKSKGKIKYQPYPVWGYLFHLAFILLPCVCIAYPFLKNINWTRNRTDSDHTLRSIVCEPCKHCYRGRSRSYQVSFSIDPPYANGHVNPGVNED